MGDDRTTQNLNSPKEMDFKKVSKIIKLKNKFDYRKYHSTSF